MKFCALVIVGILIVLGLTSCTKSESSKDHHVILISIDGFPAWLWNDESLQHMGAETDAFGSSTGTLSGI